MNAEAGQHPYRPVPLDVVQPQPPELPNCRWCSFSRSMGFDHQKCVSPEHMIRERSDYPETKGIRVEDCRSYRPSLLTRALRMLGLRLPVSKLAVVDLLEKGSDA